MPKFWWVLTVGVGLGGCALPDNFPDNAHTPGAGGDPAVREGGAGGTATSSGASGVGGAAGAASEPCGDANPLRPECEDWLACDSCASACACETECVSQCVSGLVGAGAVGSPIAEARLSACDSAVVSCFGESLGGVQACATLMPCCEHFAASDDGPACQGIVNRGLASICLSLHLAYIESGGCK